MGDEVAIYVADDDHNHNGWDDCEYDLEPSSSISSSSSSIRICRICHEAEEFIIIINGSSAAAAAYNNNNNNIMESPCSCSGTIKFAHRECIQRWCNEKGNTVCELCSQKYEPGYTAPKLVGATTTAAIRGSVEISISSEDDDDDEEEEDSASICSPADDDDDDHHHRRRRQRSSNSCCTSFALVITLLLLLRNVYEELVVDEEEKYDDPPFSVPTVLILKASGIFLPMFVLSRILALILNTIRNYGRQPPQRSYYY